MVSLEVVLSVTSTLPHPPTVCRFKPLQKVDGMSDSLCGSSQHCNNTPEQSVAAQSQHHQQYIGESVRQHRVTIHCSCSSSTLCLSASLSPCSLRADTSHSLPQFPSLDLGTQPLPERINMNDIKKLQTLYRDHCEVPRSHPHHSCDKLK